MARRDVVAILRVQLQSKRAKLAKRLAKLTVRMPRRADQKIGCLLYKGALNGDGYGGMNFRHDGRHVKLLVHVLCWVLANGRNVDPELELDHVCNISHCCEPSHLEEVTHQVNCQRRLGRVPWTLAHAAQQMRENRLTAA